MSLRATDRSDRRRRRQTEFHIEFSLSSLNLSSDIASTAVTELSKHQETIQATAAMSFKDALVVHDDCIRSCSNKLKQLHQKLVDSGQAPTEDHQALVQLHSNAIDSHTKLLNVRKALQANGTKHTKNHLLAVINQHSDHIHQIKKKVSQQHNLPNVGFSVAKVISILHKHPAHALPASIKQEQQGRSSHNVMDDARLSSSSDEEEDSSSGGGKTEENDDGANWFEKIEFAHTAAARFDGRRTGSVGASVEPGQPVESGQPQLSSTGTPTTTTTTTTTITTIALEKIKAENEQRRKTTEMQTTTIAQLQLELTECRVQLKSNAQTAASAAFRAKQLVESNQQLSAEKKTTEAKIIALDKAKLEWQTARTADSQSTQTATDAALQELEQKHSRQAIKMQQLEMHLRQKSVDIENTQREHERELEQKQVTFLSPSSLAVSPPHSIPVLPLTDLVHSSSLYLWLMSCNTQQIDLSQYAQNIYHAQIGMDSLQVLEDDEVLASLITSATHRTLLKCCVRDRQQQENIQAAEMERVQGLLLHAWMKGCVKDLKESTINEIVHHLDRHGIGLNNLDILLHDGIAAPLIPNAQNRHCVVAAILLYREQSVVFGTGAFNRGSSELSPGPGPGPGAGAGAGADTRRGDALLKPNNLSFGGGSGSGSGQTQEDSFAQQKLDNAVRKMEAMSESMAESMAAANERTEHNLCEFQSYLTAMRKEAVNSASREGGIPETTHAIHPMRPSLPSPAVGEAESLFVARNGRMTLRLGKLPAHPSTSLNKRRKKKTSSTGAKRKGLMVGGW